MCTVRCSGYLGRGCVCLGVCVQGGVCLGCVCVQKGSVFRGCPGVYTSPLWTEFLTHACENITFPQLLWRTVINCSTRIFSKPRNAWCGSGQTTLERLKVNWIWMFYNQTNYLTWAKLLPCIFSNPLGTSSRTLYLSQRLQSFVLQVTRKGSAGGEENKVAWL